MKRVGQNIADTVVLMRPIEDGNNEPAGQFTARPSPKVEHHVKQMRPHIGMHLIKARVTAISEHCDLRACL